MFIGGIEALLLIPNIVLGIFMICVLIRLYNTLYYARKAYKKYLGIAEKTKETAENDATQDDAQQQ